MYVSIYVSMYVMKKSCITVYACIYVIIPGEII